MRSILTAADAVKSNEFLENGRILGPYLAGILRELMVIGVGIERYLTIIEAVACRVTVNEVKWKSENKNNVQEIFDFL